MKLLLLLISAIISAHTSCAQTNWYTPEVAGQLGIGAAADALARPSPFPTQQFKLPNCRIAAAQVALFDTVATYAQGRVVDGRSYRPIAGVTVEVVSRCFDWPVTTQTAVTDSAGFFRLGWVGCGGPVPRSNQLLRIQVAGYPLVATQAVSFGGLAYLHIELLARPRRR